jgi:integrase
MLLAQAVDAYLDEHEVSRLYAAGLRRQVRKLAAAGVTKVSDLTAQSLNAFLAALPLSQTSRANARREICTIWRFCHEQGWTEEFPARVRRIRCRPQPPQAWSYPTLSAVVKSSLQDQRSVSNRLRDLRYCDVIPAWASIGWETALRFGDIHSLRHSDFRNGCICVVAQKTGKPTVRKISDQTFNLCSALLKRSPDGTLFAWAIPRRRAFVMWREFLDGHKIKGSSKWLRRSSATWVDGKNPGAAARFLGHDSYATTQRFYLDAAMLETPEPPPPLQLS